MELLEKIKLELRFDDSTFDDSLQDAISSCKDDMKLCGILENKIKDDDALILRAIKDYCKATYSKDEKESERYTKAYEKLRDHLSLSIEYTME